MSWHIAARLVIAVNTSQISIKNQPGQDNLPH